MKNMLRVLRAEREWSQQELADRLSVSRQTVNALETGKYDPSLPLAFRIATLFDRAIEAIFQPEVTPPARPTGPNAFIGQIAVARTPLAPHGFVFIQGERWSASLTQGSADEGERVRVIGVDGLQLYVLKEDTHG